MKKHLKNKYTISFLLGCITAFSFAPYHLFFTAIIGLSGLFLLANNCEKNKESFLIGFSFGFGYFLIGLYWISISLFVDIAKFGWLLPFSITLIPAALACYVGFAILFTNILADFFCLNKIKKLFLLAIIWVTFEWLRAILFTGFPWNLIGYNLGFSDNLVQIASIFGIYGLSLISLIICLAPALFFTLQNGKLKFLSDKINFFTGLTILILFSLTWFYGYDRLKNSSNQQVQNGSLRLVQPAIKQDEKWDTKSRYDSFVKNITLTNSANIENINYVIWSESAVSYIVEQNSYKLLSEISKAVPKNGFLITGALRAKFKDVYKNEIDQIWNSVFVIDQAGKISASYDKNHLVPFGEYIPFQRFFPFISKITNGGIGFSSGTAPKTIKLNDWLPSFGTLICYEIIFNDNIIDEKNPPQFLVNITNDAWFGDSSGPYQHLDMAKIRAIEFGIPIARVANNGISALIDPYGRIVAKLDLNEVGILDVKLMKNLPKTIYNKYGKNLLLLLVCFILLLVLCGIYRPSTKDSKTLS